MHNTINRNINFISIYYINDNIIIFQQLRYDGTINHILRNIYIMDNDITSIKIIIYIIIIL